jgi:hypothetical protein
MSDVPSPFDTPVWLSHPLPPLPHPQYPRADEVDLYNKHRQIKVPGLVHLIRQLRNDHANLVLRHQVFALAVELYKTTLNDWIRQLFDLHLLRWSFGDQPPMGHDSTIEQLQATIPSLRFSTSRLYMRFLIYHEMRCILSGCIQMICSIPYPPYSTPTAATFDLAAAQAEDLRAASMIAACDEYAVSDSSPLNMRQQHLAGSALFSYGSWRRLELRASEDVTTMGESTLKTATGTFPCPPFNDIDSTVPQNPLHTVLDLSGCATMDYELNHARAMKSWVLKKLHWSSRTWGSRTWTESDLNWLVDIAAGADLQRPSSRDPANGEKTIYETVKVWSSRVEGL